MIQPPLLAILINTANIFVQGTFATFLLFVSGLGVMSWLARTKGLSGRQIYLLLIGTSMAGFLAAHLAGCDRANPGESGCASGFWTRKPP